MQIDPGIRYSICLYITFDKNKIRIELNNFSLLLICIFNKLLYTTARSVIKDTEDTTMKPNNHKHPKDLQRKDAVKSPEDATRLHKNARYQHIATKAHSTAKKLDIHGQFGSRSHAKSTFVKDGYDKMNIDREMSNSCK